MVYQSATETTPLYTLPRRASGMYPPEMKVEVRTPPSKSEYLPPLTGKRWGDSAMTVPWKLVGFWKSCDKANNLGCYSCYMPKLRLGISKKSLMHSLNAARRASGHLRG